MSELGEEEALMRKFRERQNDHVSMLWILALLLRERRLLLGLTAIGLVIGVLIAVFRTPTYTTTFSFVPQVTQDAGRTGLASLAGQFGVALGDANQSQSPQFYADLLSTRELLGPVAGASYAIIGRRAPVQLPELLDVSGASQPVKLENTVSKLRDKVISSSVAARTTGVVSVRVRTRWPELSLAIAERLIDGVNRFNLLTRQSQAAAERKFVEGRLDASHATLRAAEDALQDFLQSNRQIENSAQLTFQRDRLERAVTLQQQIVTGLAQQYEDARLREVRDTPVITIVERPSLAVRTDPRKRILTVAAGMSVALLVALSFVIARDAIRRRKSESDPAASLLASEWSDLRKFRR